jgi:predicted RNA polymerase sigma factor
MLLHHARRCARIDAAGMLIPLDEQDRHLWDRDLIAEAVDLLQTALAQEQHGEYQVQAAIAALHDDAQTAAETDWPQILAWYDELMALTHNPLAGLNRAVALAEVEGPLAGLRAVDQVSVDLGDYFRLDAVRGHLQQRAGNHEAAAGLFTKAADGATSVAERNHLLRRAAEARQASRQPR